MQISDYHFYLDPILAHRSAWARLGAFLSLYSCRCVFNYTSMVNMLKDFKDKSIFYQESIIHANVAYETTFERQFIFIS